MDESQSDVKAESGKVRSGKARMEKMTPEQRREMARSGAKERWRQARAAQAIESDTGMEVPGLNDGKIYSGEELIINPINNLPIAKWPGSLEVGISCYVLEDGRRVISRTGATDFLTGGKGGGNLENYTGIQALRAYLPENLPGEMIEFNLPGVVNKSVRGMRAETFLDICTAYVKAWQDGKLESEVQIKIAMKAAIFTTACAKIGLIALIDEATGYQYERPFDALQFKLKLFLAEEMRKWEKTFPDDLWVQFGRLTKWKGQLNSRPKYWGNLVMDLIYEYLDADVAQWLRENAPKPLKGKNYHQWMTEQYGLKRLIEHIWKVIGIASTCEDIKELKAKMEELYGKNAGFQYQFKLLPGKQS